MAVLHRFQRASVGRRDDADIGSKFRARPDPVEFFRLQYAQQARLHVERHFDHFVEQQRSALSPLEYAGVGAHRSGEAPLLVAEEFRLDEPGRDCAAIDCNERTVAARTALVDRLGRQLLAGAAFAGQENAGLGGADALDEPKHFLHCQGFPQQSRASRQGRLDLRQLL